MASNSRQIPIFKNGLLLGAVFVFACDTAPKVEEKSPKATVKAGDTSVTLTWEETEDPTVVSYKIYLSPAKKETGSLLKTVDALAAEFDPSIPKVVMDTKADEVLGEFKGLPACFAISAVDKEGLESDRSSPVCVTLAK